MPNWITGLGQNLGNQAAGGLMGLMLSGINDKRQIRQQQELQDMQIRGQMQLTDYNYLKQMEMWEATNYAAQVAQMKKAGINPALLYGMGGGGGQSTNIAQGNVGQGHAPAGGGEIMGLMQQNALMDAQRRNIDADTKLKETEANKKAGIDTEEGKTRILDLLAGVQNKNAQTALTTVQKDIASIDLKIKDKTMEDQIDIVFWNAIKSINEVKQLKRANDIGDLTAQTIVKKIKAEYVQTLLQNALLTAEIQTEKTKPGLIKAQTALTKEQTDSIDYMIAQKWEQLEIDLQNASTNEKTQVMQSYLKDVPDSERIPMDVVNGLINIILLKGIIGSADEQRMQREDQRMDKQLQHQKELHDYKTPGRYPEIKGFKR